MPIDPKVKRDFNLTGEQLEFMEMLRREAEDIPVPLALEPDMMKQRLPSKQKTPAWKVLSPIMAAAVACFALVVVGQQNLWMVGDPGISSNPPSVSGTFEGPQTLEPGEPSQQPADDGSNINEPSNQQDTSFQNEVEGNLSAGTQSPPSETNEEEENLPSSNSESSSDGTDYGEALVGGSQGGTSEYSDIFEKISELNKMNPAQVKGVAYSSNFSTIFGNNPSLMSARQTNVGSQTDIAQFDGEYIYSISEDLSTGRQSVVISAVDGSKSRVIAELFVDFGMQNDADYEFSNIQLLNCYVSQGRLTIVGSAYYKPAGSEEKQNTSDIVTAVATYDISNPQFPELISNSYQDGCLLSSRISGGFLYLVTRKTVSDPAEETVQSYVPFQMTGGDYETVGADDIYVSQYAQSPCYIVASSILLKEPESFYDTMAIIGDSSELYINENSIYLADYVYQNGSTYTSIVKSEFGKGNFDFVGEIELLGRLFDSESIDEYQGVLRVITTRGNDNILYTLDQHLQKVATLDDIADGERISAAYFDKEKIYFVTANEPDQVTVIDVSDAAQPAESKKLALPNHTMPMIPFGDGQMASLEIQESENPGLKLSLYDMLSPSRIIEISSALAVEGDIYSESIDNPQALLTIPERGLIGFSYFKYDAASGESGCYYALYQLSAEGVVKKVEYQYPSKVYNQRGFVKDNVLYVTSASSLVAFNIDSGQMLWQINF